MHAAVTPPVSPAPGAESKVGLPVVGLALLLLASVLIGLGLSVGAQAVLLAAASAVLVGIVWLFWASLQALTGRAALTLDEALGLAAPSAQEEQKRAALRILKDLDYERSVGKLSEEDYRVLAHHHRQEAKVLLAELDQSLAPMRARAEQMLAEKLEEVAISPPKSEPGTQPQPPALEDDAAPQHVER